MCSRNLHVFRFLIVGMLGLLFSLSVLAADMVPYLQTPGSNSIWVSWKTAVDGDSTVEYGLNENQLNLKATGTSQALATNYFFHGVQLTNLNPTTFYFYRIRTNTSVSPTYRFKTQDLPSQASGKFRILVTGDHQIIDQDRHLTLLTRARKTIEGIYGKPLEEVVNLMINDGDQVDVGTLDHYENLHMRQTEPVSKNIATMTTVGNHEVYYDTGMKLWQAHFFINGLSYQGIAPAPDETYYANQVGRVLFIHMNSEATSDTQLNWVKQVVAKADVDSNVDWIISVIHRPYQAEQYVGDISSWLRNQVMPVLNSSRKHALNIAGHHHLYARGQVGDAPAYHMISGGDAWDQYWGQSTEQDFDDVQKTIANWTWQLIEIDLATKEMTVKSYSEAHPKLGFVYDSKLTDEFHRKLNNGAPDKPVLSNAVTQPITLPYTLTSGSFLSVYGELLNTTHFQVARDASFADIVLDKKRDVEDLFGDTGAPDYLPVDVNANTDIMSYTIPGFGLSNGKYFARIRHRDTNVEWSAWSDSVPFEVTGSTTGASLLALDKSIYATADVVRVTYSNGRNNPKDWVGVYQDGQTPGKVASTKFSYVNSQSLINGTVSFSGLTSGKAYFAGFFTNDSYTEIAPRVKFYVGPTPAITLNKTAFALGETVALTWTGAPGGTKDWIGVYKVGEVPGSVGSTQWSYTPSVSGAINFSNLAKGYYYAVYLLNDGYFEIGSRVPFQVGDKIANLSMSSSLPSGVSSFDVSFTGGPGIAKDYLGIFKKGAVPGVDKLVAYEYVGGKAANTVTFKSAIPDGEYFVALYTNDSYTEVSNRVSFTVGSGVSTPPTMTITKTKFTDGEPVRITWANTPGGAKDWIGIYKSGQVPGPTPSLKWSYVSGSSGSLDFSGLVAGDYFAAYLLNDGYQEAVTRVTFSVVKLGDINGDGKIDVQDRNVLQGAMGSCTGVAKYVADADFDGDNCITIQDYKRWYALFQKQ